MLALFRDHQLNIMLALCGACGICAAFVMVSDTFSPQKKRALVLLELCAMGLLLFDRGCDLYDGDPSVKGYWMVRICNFLIFFFSEAIIFFFNLYLMAVVRDDDGILVMPKRLKVTAVLSAVGAGLVIVSQFTDLYYTFDANNTYQRAPGFLICYIFPVLIPVIQLTYIFQAYRKLNRKIRLSLLLFPLIPLLASMIQMLVYGIYLTDMSLAVMSIILYVFALSDVNSIVDEARERELEILKKEEKEVSNLFNQIVTTFVSAIDAKDVNRKGHAVRVAGYARKLAGMTGKDENECEEAYLSALLHDVGKISLPDKILKKEKMTKDERKTYEQHVNKGRDILSGIKEYPYLKDAAAYHHEWYDGSGYPAKLAGEEIPEYARLVAMVDGYDDMASIRYGRQPLPQQVIREEIIKESGRHYDPVYAKAMIEMIDSDEDYRLREHLEDETERLEEELWCEEYRSKCSRGIAITDEVCRINFRFESTLGEEDGFASPSIILFDSMDGCTHTTKDSVLINKYTEFGELWFDGHVICTRARKIQAETNESETKNGEYQVVVVRVKDHVRVNMIGNNLRSEMIVALPDSSGTMYVSITGENAHITDIQAGNIGISLKEGDIPRIVDEITFINRMIGDVPNVQVDSYCSASTEGRSITDGMKIFFHTMTLPGATLVWNCPFLVFFKSDDHRVNGENYEELVIIRLDGESVETAGQARSETEMSEEEEFENWDAWKEYNKRGFECKVTFRRYSDRITMHTKNAGIEVKSTIYMEERMEDICVAITGDQCALTDIRFVS